MPTVEATRGLAAAGITRDRLGRNRLRSLTDRERLLYRWILGRFATSGRPRRTDVEGEAHRLGLDLPAALATLAREDLVCLGPDGEIAVAYPFSGRPTAHRVRLRRGHEAYAMCAIDALGIAPMLGEEIEIFSSDPLTGEEIEVALAPNGEGRWPQSAVVVSGTTASDAGSCGSCCPVLNFFASHDNAETWLDARSDVRGVVISLEEAILAGREVFGNVLKEA